MNTLNVLAYLHDAAYDGLLIGGAALVVAAALWNWLRDRWLG